MNQGGRIVANPASYCDSYAVSVTGLESTRLASQHKHAGAAGGSTWLFIGLRACFRPALERAAGSACLSRTQPGPSGSFDDGAHWPLRRNKPARVVRRYPQVHSTRFVVADVRGPGPKMAGVRDNAGSSRRASTVTGPWSQPADSRPIIPAGVFRRALFVEGTRDDVRPLAAKSRATRGHDTHKSHRIVAALECGDGYGQRAPLRWPRRK